MGERGAHPYLFYKRINTLQEICCSFRRLLRRSERFRREACEIPEPLYGHSLTPSDKQDVVKVDIHPVDPEPAVLPLQEKADGMHFDNSHTAEIMISDITICQSEEVNSGLIRT